MPLLLHGSCHCRKIKYTVESNTPVPYQICQCSICRKVGGYMGVSNIMGNNATLNIIRGKELLKDYYAPVEFDENDEPKVQGNSKRSFCSNCSTMMWNWHEEWPQWIYPFASTIDSPDLPAPPKGVPGIALMRKYCPEYVPIPGADKMWEKWERYELYPPGEGIEAWHKENGCWID
ncbi:Putative glutathione-dependent formaldehyde-activating enzyme [Vanrija pseudolonga]|uniref:Glutathione-dependent formaldehyde-activating enzyme n=1 Tax=Vanrija pseudolonga TaxID=143232 RepID=A0AAF0YC40_9TREE|nr:Putative glutathione-dependent formaldehyde-activating enzyme [Vanrija pseudolonga]